MGEIGGDMREEPGGISDPGANGHGLEDAGNTSFEGSSSGSGMESGFSGSGTESNGSGSGTESGFSGSGTESNGSGSTMGSDGSGSGMKRNFVDSDGVSEDNPTESAADRHGSEGEPGTGAHGETQKEEETSLNDRGEGEEVQKVHKGKVEKKRADGKKERKTGAEGADEQQGTLWTELIEWIKVIAVAAVAAFFLNNFIIANSTIPTGSMEDTIPSHSRVFGSRISYTFGDVKRDDVGIFIYGYTCRSCHAQYRETSYGVCPNCGREDSKNSVVYYVKRVIGLPGDHIEIRRTGDVPESDIVKMRVRSYTGMVPVGTLYLNGEPKEEWYLPEPMLCDGERYPEIDVTVPEGCYYMLGDNRNNSLDARYWGENNFVRREKMVAKVYFQYWPISDIGIIK